MPGTGDDDYYLWNAWMVGPWLICGGWMSVILAWGLYVVAMGNAPFTERNALKTTTTSSFLLRPLVELSVATAGWVLLGWAMVDGGDTRLFVGTHQFATVGTPDYALWFFQLALLFVAVAVVSNACTSKRIDGPARVVVLLFYALAVFSPLFHWLWSQWGWASPYRSVFQQDLLLDCGVVDTAGASVIHLSAGTAGLVLLWLLGDRHEATAHRAHALKHRDAFTSTAAFANVCGPLFVWVGFVGLHVSTNLPQVNAAYAAGRRLVMTCVSSAAASLVAYLHVSFNCRDLEVLPKRGDLRARNILYLKCFLAGLVAVSASCSTCELEGAATIGIVAASLTIATTVFQRYVGIDVAEMAVSVHMLGGLWGLLAAGLLTSQAGYEVTYADAYGGGGPPSERSTHCQGAFYGGPGWQFGAQIVYALAVVAWTVCTMVPAVLFMQVLFPASFFEDVMDAEIPTGIAKKTLPMPSPAAAGNNNAVPSKKNEFKSKMEAWRRYGYSWDYAIVVPRPQNAITKEVTETTKNKTFMSMTATPELDAQSSSLFRIIRALHKGRLRTRQIMSGDYVIIKVHAPLKTLSQMAYEVDYRLLLDEEKTKAAAKKGVAEVIRGKGKVSEGSIAPIEIADGVDLGLRLPFRPFESIYAAYCLKLPFKRTDTVRENLFQDAVFPVGAAAAEAEDGDPFPPVNHPFSGIHRLKLMHMILEGDVGDTCGLNFDALMASKEVVAHFPLHDRQEKRDLKKAWLSVSVMPWRQPDDMIRAYFGEHVALYFKFVAYYATAVGVAAVAGVGVSIHVIVQATRDGNLYHALQTVYSVPAFCVFIAVWSRGLVDHWAQTQAVQAFKWGMDDYDETEQERKEYYGEAGPSFVDGRKTKYFPMYQKQRRLQVSVAVTTGFMLIAIGAVAGVFALKSYLVNSIKMANGDTLANFVNFAQVSILKLTFDSVAKWLTEQENCKTDTMYENSLVVKLFAFNAVNAYAAVFYIAFIKEVVGDRCVMNSCIGELAETLLIVFGSHLAQSPITQLVVPPIVRCVTSCFKSGADPPTARNQIERQLDRETYSPRDAIEDYSSLAIDFGYMTLFVAAVPFVPLLAFVALFLEIRIDGYKLLNEFRRPLPLGREDIGMWYQIFKGISYAGVFTNAAIVFYTGNYFEYLHGSQKLATAAVSVVIVFTLRAIYSHLVGGEAPVGLQVQRQRRDFIVSKVVVKEPDPVDGDDDAVAAGGGPGASTEDIGDREEEEGENGYEATKKVADK